jgi:topoisomerase-4 subunit B
MAAKKNQEYDESKIKTLSSLEHIRLRSGMYIGRLGDGNNQDDGIYILLKEVIDNSVDEFIMGFGNRIAIEIKDNTVKVRDYGRGIPLGKVIDCVSMINTGAKYNDDVFQFSVGLNGVGTKAVNALSSHFRVVSIREEKYMEAVFERGILKSQKSGVKKGEKNGTYVEFVPDKEIFGEFVYSQEFVEHRLWNYAYLNRGLTLLFGKQKFYSEKGLYDLLNSEVGDDIYYDIAYHTGEKIEFAFTTHQNIWRDFFLFCKRPVYKRRGNSPERFQGRASKGCQRVLQEKLFRTGCKGRDCRRCRDKA